MNKDRILLETEGYVKREMSSESTGHDYSHIKATERNALRIQKREGGDLFIIRMAVQLHDIGDVKLHNGDTTATKRIVGGWLENQRVSSPEAEHILYIVDNMSFSKALFGKPIEKSLEFKVVQDADWLEALGAIGIARCIHYGGSTGRKIYDADTPNTPLTAERYRKVKDSITHLGEKGLILPKMLNTETARKIGQKRHKILVDFLRQFYLEVSGHDFTTLDSI